MTCFNKKHQHIGRLKTLIDIDTGWNCSASVRWCPRCGATVVDRISDGRIFGHYVNMQFPEITKNSNFSRKDLVNG